MQIELKVGGNFTDKMTLYNMQIELKVGGSFTN